MRIILGHVLALVALSSATVAADRLSAVFEDSVHPVLLRKQQNEIGRLVIDVPADQRAILEIASISLEGAGDVKSLALVGGSLAVTTAPDAAFRLEHPADDVRLQGQADLRPGENIFTLVCSLRDNARPSGRIRAEVTEIATSEGKIVPERRGNATGHRIGVALRQAGEDGVHTFRIPALATTRRGSLLCVYDIRRQGKRDLQANIDVGLSRSADGGLTWEPLRVILDMGAYGGLPKAQNGVGDPGIIVDQETGQIFVFALWVHGKPGTHQWRGDGSEPGFEIGKTAQFLVTRSRDDGQTWTAPENITRQVKREEWILLAPSPQQGIQLRDGTLAMPVQGRDADGPFAAIMTSVDHGASWSVSSRAVSGGNECQAAELHDGSIMLNVRNGGKKRRAVVVSHDRGASWQAHPTHERALIEPTCNGSLYRWTSREPGSPPLLLFANPQDESRRRNHTIQVSLDDGTTWTGRLLLDDGLGFGYPSMSRIDDDCIGIVYEGSQSHLVFERISREELLGAKQ